MMKLYKEERNNDFIVFGIEKEKRTPALMVINEG